MRSGASGVSPQAYSALGGRLSAPPRVPGAGRGCSPRARLHAGAGTPREPLAWRSEPRTQVWQCTGCPALLGFSGILFPSFLPCQGGAGACCFPQARW